MEALITVLAIIGIFMFISLIALLMLWGIENRQMKHEKESRCCENCTHCDAVYPNNSVVCGKAYAEKPIYCSHFEKK